MTIVMKEEEEEEKHCADYNDDEVCGDDINFIPFTACCGLASNITEHCYNEQARVNSSVHIWPEASKPGHLNSAKGNSNTPSRSGS